MAHDLFYLTWSVWTLEHSDPIEDTQQDTDA